MKNLILSVCAISFLLGCKEKDTYPVFDPNSRIISPKADFKYTVGENGVLNLQFVLNYKDFYAIDLGNGTIIRDSVGSSSQIPLNYPVTKTIQFGKNGNYNIRLTVANIKGVASSSQAINIENIPPPPVAAFTYEKTADGEVKFINQSKNYQKVEWRRSRKVDYVGFTSRAEDPGYKFENNDTYYISLMVTSKYGLTHFVSDSIKITTAPNINNPIFEGTFFDQTGKLPGTGINTIGESWGAAGLGSFSINNFVFKNKGNIMIILGRPETTFVEEKYRFYKQRLKIGKLERGKIDILITRAGILWHKGEETLRPWDDPNAEIEIVEVNEVDQNKLFAEMYEKSFWVTFLIKADLGAKGKIDGKLKVRYLVY